MSVNIPPETIEEIGKIISPSSDWAGTLARLLHRHAPNPSEFGEEDVLAWAAGVEPVPEWAIQPMGRFLGIHDGFLALKRGRCQTIGRILRGEEP